MKTRTFVAAVAAAVLLIAVGCGRQSSDPGDAPGSGNWDPALADHARLVDQLPADTIAYLRLPSPWGLAAAPKDSALSGGLDTGANRQAVATLQQRLPEIAEAELGSLAPVLTLLLESLRSPLEFALVGDDPQPLEADLFIEGRFRFESATALDDALAELTGQASLLQHVARADANGTGQIVATMFPVFYRFDPDTGRARFLTGMAASAEDLTASQDWQPADEPAMQSYEQRIDASRHGLFLWADTARLAPLMRQGLGAEELEWFESLGVFATRQLALGYGSSDGKARLAMLAEGSEGRVWDLTFPEAPPIEFASSGEPGMVVGLRLPGSNWVRHALESAGGEAEATLASFDARLEEELGLDLATVFDTFAGRMIYVDDANGAYLVHEGGDAERWRRFWDTLSQRFDIRRSTHRAGNTEIRHLVIPGLDVGDSLDDLREDEPALAFLIGQSMQIGSHLFWMAEEDRVLIAAVPQVLMARLEHAGDVSVGDWLARAGVATERAGLFGAMRVDNAPRRNYYTYISWLLGLADMLETEVDVTAFPTARELDLPDHGTIGFGIDYSNGHLGATLVFENHPGDLLYAGGGSLGGVAALGVLAAVAVPAYQDYTVRSKVTAAYSRGLELGETIQDWTSVKGGFHGADVGAFLENQPQEVSSEWYRWESKPPALVIQFFATSGLDEGSELRLTPIVEDGLISGWTCSSDSIEPSHLPAACR